MSAVKSIYAGVRSLGIAEEEDRRDFFEQVTGKRRLREMSPGEKDAVAEELRRRGARPTGRRRLEGPYAKKLQALWIAAWNLGITRSRHDEALLAFVKRQTGLDHTRFLVDAAAAARAVEGLKVWVAREGGVNWGDAERPSWMRDHGAKVAWAQWLRLSAESSHEEFVAAVYAITGPKSGLHAIKSREWHAVTNAFGVRLRAAAKAS